MFSKQCSAYFGSFWLCSLQMLVAAGSTGESERLPSTCATTALQLQIMNQHLLLGQISEAPAIAKFPIIPQKQNKIHYELLCADQKP
jgi:hypothetical protein